MRAHLLPARYVAICLSLLPLLAAHVTAGPASIFSDTATVQANALLPAQSAPLSQTSLLAFSNSGQSFTNSSGVASGSQVRTVGAVSLDSLHSAGTPRLGITGSGGGQLVGIFGLMGYRQQDMTSGQPNVSHDVSDGGFGRLRIVELPTGASFNADDISSWGLAERVLAEYTIFPRQPVESGRQLGIAEARDIALPSDAVNMAGITTTLGDIQGGVAVLKEDSTPGVPGLLDSDGFANLAPATMEMMDELVILNYQHQVVELDSDLLTADEQTLLNAIAEFAFGGNFADFGSGTGDDFRAGNGVGDTASYLSVDLLPAVLAQPVTAPEPTAVAAWLAMGAIGLVTRKAFTLRQLRRG